MRKDDGRSRKRKRLLECDWPSADRSLWQTAFVSADVFDENGAGVHFASQTRFCLQYAYGRWLAHLSETEPEALALAPAARVTPARVRTFADALGKTNTPRSTAATLRHFRHALRIVGVPDHFRWIAAIASRLEATCPARSKHHKVRTSDELFSLGLALMDEAEATSGKPNIIDAQLYRDGLAIALLAVLPLRRSNLANLSIGRNLLQVGSDWVICLSSAETKNRREYEASLGPLSRRLDQFLDVFRPVFHNASKHSALWPSIKGVPLTGNAVYDLIIRRTKAHFGQAVNPHLFRDGAATFWALETPEIIGGASALLGHSDPSTLKHYNQARSVAAGRRLASLLRNRAGGRGPDHAAAR